jgi:hypothetical protein
MGTFAPVLLIAGFASRSPAGIDSVAGIVMLLAAVLALGGLWVWEDLWVKAGQSIPLS